VLEGARGPRRGLELERAVEEVVQLGRRELLAGEEVPGQVGKTTQMRVLTWNLFHGRSLPGSGRDLTAEFAETIAGWAWDVALLQEVPPWWGPALGRASGASARTALTSRNALLPLRKALATRFPDVVKSEGGGSNTILVRGQAIVEHRYATLRLRPERRVVHAVRTADGVWWGNIHAQVHSDEHALADAREAARELLAWSAGAARVVFGGDWNIRRPIAPGFVHLGGNNIDHVLARGWKRVGARLLDAGTLSDHNPVLVEMEAGRPSKEEAIASIEAVLGGDAADRPPTPEAIVADLAADRR